MIEIDRTSEIPIYAQILNRFRFLIANGHYRTGQLLPSTRSLASQLDISFHTVRKAYGTLEEEGFLVTYPGRGFVVSDFEPTRKSETLERGAALVKSLVQQLIGLGLDESDVEYLIQEQMSLLETEDYPFKIVVAGPYLEWSQQCADQLMSVFQKEIFPVSVGNLKKHADADFILVPFREVRGVLAAAPTGDVIGIQTELNAEALGHVSRLLERETLGVVTHYADAIGPLTSELRTQTRFSGQVLAVSVEDGDEHAGPLLRQCDMILHTDAAERRIKNSLPPALRHYSLKIRIAKSSVERLREQIPT